MSAARVPEGAPIDYAALYESREALLRRAFSRLGGAEAQSVRDFAAANPWLGEYALYRALKACFGQTAWFDWPDKDLLNHDPAALAAAGRSWRRISLFTRRCSSGSSPSGRL